MAFIRNTDKFIEGSKLFFSNERAKAAVQSDLDLLASEDSAIKLRLDTIEGSGEGSIAKSLLDAKAYADQKVAALVNSAPEVLDTLKELSDAIGGDQNFAATIAGQIGAEQSRATAAEALLSGRIAALEADPVTKAYVDAADSALSEQISNNYSEFFGVVNDVNGRLAGLETVDDGLMARLEVLEADPVTKTYVDGQVSGLQSQVDTEKGRIDAILSASEADKNSFAEIVSLINSVDTSNDQAFAGYVLSNDAALAQEVSDRQAGDSALSLRLDALEADPVTKAYVDGQVASEQSARESADNSLSGRLDALESDPTTKSYVDGIQSALDTRIDSLELDSVTKAYVDASKLSENVQSISSSTSVSSSSQTQVFFCNVSGGSVTVTLPSASSVVVGRKFAVKDTGSSSPSGNFITVAAQSGQTVDGQSSFEMKMPFEAAQFVSDGTQWFVM